VAAVTVGQYRVIARGVGGDVTLDEPFDNEADAQAFAHDVKHWGAGGPDIFPEDVINVYVAREVL
jgi:hypothetical protein